MSTDPESQPEQFVRRKFSSAPVEPTVDDADEGQVSKPLLSTKALIAGVSLFVGSVICVVAAVSVAPPPAEVPKEVTSAAVALQDQTRAAKAALADLPDTKAVTRSLVTAQKAADAVASVQNSYRRVAPQVAANEGVYDEAWGVAAKRSLTGFFVLGIEETAAQPWYLLADDADEEDHSGIPELFNSGFKWEAQTPTKINLDGSVSVVWLAQQDGKILAWAEGTYDRKRNSFRSIEVGTTALGASKQLNYTTEDPDA